MSWAVHVTISLTFKISLFNTHVLDSCNKILNFVYNKMICIANFWHVLADWSPCISNIPPEKGLFVNFHDFLDFYSIFASISRKLEWTIILNIFWGLESPTNPLYQIPTKLASIYMQYLYPMSFCDNYLIHVDIWIKDTRTVTFDVDFAGSKTDLKNIFVLFDSACR